jgi:hypothetical protein
MKRKVLIGAFLIVPLTVTSLSFAGGTRPPEGETYFFNSESLDIFVDTHTEADPNNKAKAMDLQYEPVCQNPSTPNRTVSDIAIRRDGTFEFRGAPDTGIGKIRFEGNFVSNARIRATLVERSNAFGGCFRKTDTPLQIVN